MNAFQHAQVPIAVFRGAHHERLACSFPWQRLFDQGMPPELRTALGVVYRSGKPLELELEVGKRYYRVHVKAVPGNELIATCIDETELVAATQAAARATWMKEKVLSAISHDLRTPLSTLLLWERILRDHVDEPEIRVQALNAIRESASAQADAIAVLVDVYRLIDGAVKLEPHVAPLEDLLDAAIDAHEPQLRAKSVVMSRAYARPLGDICADGRRLGYALSKVIAMVIETSARGADVTVAAERDADDMVVRIGEPRRRAARTQESAAMRARGLDFVIASELLALHGGALASSAANDTLRGFVISLPVAHS